MQPAEVAAVLKYLSEGQSGLFPGWTPTPAQLNLWERHLARLDVSSAMTAADEMYGKQRYRKAGPDLTVFLDCLNEYRGAKRNQGTSVTRDMLHDGNGGAWLLCAKGKHQGDLRMPIAYNQHQALPEISRCITDAHRIRDEVAAMEPEAEWLVIGDQNRRVIYAEAAMMAEDYWPAARKARVGQWRADHPRPGGRLADLLNEAETATPAEPPVGISGA